MTTPAPIPTDQKIAVTIAAYVIIAVWTCVIFYKRDRSWVESVQKKHPEQYRNYSPDQSVMGSLFPGLLWPLYWTERACDATTDWAKFTEKDVP